jgi:hypothetical protein
MTTRVQLGDVISIAVPGSATRYYISDDEQQTGTYRIELVDTDNGPMDCGGGRSPLGKALGAHYVLTPNGTNDDDPSVPGGNGAGYIVPVQLAVVTFRRAIPNRPS